MAKNEEKNNPAETPTPEQIQAAEMLLNQAASGVTPPAGQASTNVDHAYEGGASSVTLVHDTFTNGVEDPDAFIRQFYPVNQPENRPVGGDGVPDPLATMQESMAEKWQDSHKDEALALYGDMTSKKAYAARERRKNIDAYEAVEAEQAKTAAAEQANRRWTLGAQICGLFIALAFVVYMLVAVNTPPEATIRGLPVSTVEDAYSKAVVEKEAGNMLDALSGNSEPSADVLEALRSAR